MSRKGESVTVSMSLSEKESLNAIAIEHKCTWGAKENVSELMRKIAHGELKVIAPNAEYRIEKLMNSRECKELYILLKKYFGEE